MNSHTPELTEFHWMMDMLQTVDVGLVVMDKGYRIKLWNGFMENHSGLLPIDVRDKVIFDLFSEISEEWFRRKAETVFLLRNRAFTTWEQRPYFMKFRNYRPITGTAEYMYQNTTIIPLISTTGQVQHICVIIYDVTDIASGKLALEVANRELERLSQTDKLTQLNNRGYWEETLTREFQRCSRGGTKSSLVMFDIDHFKKVNDTYGHQAGDEVIRIVAQKLRDNLRQADCAGRYGGEEFGVILMDTNSESALYFAERLRNSIQNNPVTYENNTIEFTVSLGISEFAEGITDYKCWLEQADKALYQSKHNGRNQSTLYDNPSKAT